MENIKVSKQGYDTLRKNLESLKEELTRLGKYKNKIAAENGDVWHDNNDFEQTEIQERKLMRQISDLRSRIANAEIIEESSSANVVRFGAIVELTISGDDFSENITILFSDSDEKSEYSKISANSPIGKIIFNQKAGFEGEYEVNGNKMKARINKIRI